MGKAMTTTIELELTIKLKPEALDGGYTRYTTDDLPGFRILCEPKENPIPLIRDAMEKFMPPMLAAIHKQKITLKGLRIISSGSTFFSGRPEPITLEADFAHA
jgi:hypothetical protein